MLLIQIKSFPDLTILRPVLFAKYNSSHPDSALAVWGHIGIGSEDQEQ